MVEDEPDIAKLLAIMLGRAGYVTDIALTGEQVLDAIKRTHYAAITLDMMLPDISGLEVINRLRSQAATMDMPIIVVSAKMEEGRLAINSAYSNITWLTKPIDESKLLAEIDKYFPNKSEQKPLVLHVEDDEDIHQVIRAMAGERYNFKHALNLKTARICLAKDNFDLIILDIGLPDGSGWTLIPEIRTRHPHARVVILSGVDTTPAEAKKVEAVLLKSQVITASLA